MRNRVPRAVVATAAMAAIVALLAFGAVVALRVQRGVAIDWPDLLPPVRDRNVAANCGTQPCEVLTSLPVGAVTVELLADAEGRNGRLRVRGQDEDTVLETAVAAVDVRLTQRSLLCMRGPRSACIVKGSRAEGDLAGEVFFSDGDRWLAADLRFYSSAGYLDLLQVTGDGAPEIGVAVLPDCPGAPAACADDTVMVEVYALDGASLGCTLRFAGLRFLPGWPDVQLTEGDLTRC